MPNETYTAFDIADTSATDEYGSALDPSLELLDFTGPLLLIGMIALAFAWEFLQNLVLDIWRRLQRGRSR